MQDGEDAHDPGFFLNGEDDAVRLENEPAKGICSNVSIRA